ncbi:MAG: hypothetical protein GXZ00_01560 [Synergistaceae bacterium]|nr:hypothetical protein [Synergistaceae bacterium]
MSLFEKTAKLFSCILLLIFMTGSASADDFKVINTEKSTQHTSVFVMPVYIVLPEGCTFDKTQAGCVDKAKKVSLEASVIRLPYTVLLEEFNEATLRQDDMELKMKNEFLWNGTPVMLMKIFQKTSSTLVGKWTLIIDRGKECWMINGIYPAKDQKRSEAVLKTIKSAFWEREKDLSPIGISLGNVDVGKTSLKLAGLLDGAVVYTKDGLLPTKKDDGSLFVVSRLSNTFVTPDKQLGFAKEKMRMIEKCEKIEIISEKEVKIDGLSGVEIVGYTSGDQKKLVFQTILFDGKNCHVMVGIAKSGIPENMSLFHSVTETFKSAR